MALGDEQIDRLTNGLHGVVDELGKVLTEKIGELRELLDGIEIVNTATVNAKEIKPAEKA